LKIFLLIQLNGSRLLPHHFIKILSEVHFARLFLAKQKDKRNPDLLLDDRGSKNKFRLEKRTANPKIISKKRP